MTRSIVAGVGGLLVLLAVLGALVANAQHDGGPAIAWSAIIYAVSGLALVLAASAGSALARRRRLAVRSEKAARERLELAERQFARELERESEQRRASIDVLRMFLEQGLVSSVDLESAHKATLEHLTKISEVEESADTGAQENTRPQEKGASCRHQDAEHLTNSFPEILSSPDGRAIRDHLAAAERAQDDSLALPALWEVTHSRIGLYHDIATRQARQSFATAQVAIATGFLLLVVFAALAVTAHSTVSAITTGALGAVSAALAGYIGRTFVRSQEAAAGRLRAYFAQPLEFSRFLAAERLIAAAGDVDPERRGSILSAVVQAVVSSDHLSNASDLGESILSTASRSQKAAES